MDSRDERYLRDILSYGREALEFGHGCTVDDLASDRMRQLAVFKALEVVGEAAGKLSRDFRVQHADIASTEAVRIRNVLAHQYHGIDLQIVIGVLNYHLPSMLTSIEQLLDKDILS